jgi:hypothetical protein
MVLAQTVFAHMVAAHFEEAVDHIAFAQVVAVGQVAGMLAAYTVFVLQRSLPVAASSAQIDRTEPVRCQAVRAHRQESKARCAEQARK